MGNRPNPVNGRTIIHQNPLLVHTKEDMMRAIELAQRSARGKVFDELGISKLVAESTPSSRAIENGEPRSFMEALDQERGGLCMGNHTDDELACELFLYGDMSVEDKTRALMTGKPSSIAYLMAGKERIRWLSRHLDAALASEAALQLRIKELEEQVETIQGDLSEAYSRAEM